MIIFHEISVDKKIAEITAEHQVIETVENVLDFLGDCYYSYCMGIIVPKEVFSQEFYDLKTGLAGEILQKFSNFNMKISIFGNFSNIESNNLKDFIRECNRLKSINFVSTFEEAMGVLKK